MCATPDKATTEEFRSRTGRQRAYKVIHKRTARPYLYPNTGVPYHPGHNVDRRAVKTYLGYVRGCQRGLHCYLSRRGAQEVCRRSYQNLTVVCVTFDPGDVIAAEKVAHYMPRQIVVRALHISKQAWRQAGLPATKGGDS